MRDKGQEMSEVYIAARRKVQAKLGFYLHFFIFAAVNIVPFGLAFNTVTIGHAYELPPYLVPMWFGWCIGLLLHQQACFAGDHSYNKRSKPVSKFISDKTRNLFDKMLEKELKEMNEVRNSK